MLGIIDWGIGGVSIYKAIKKSLGIPVVYFSDTGVTPYGKMTRADLVSRLHLVIDFLTKQDVTHLAIGCNAASTAIDHLRPSTIKIGGMIESGVAAAMEKDPTRLGLIGGRRTVVSGVYRKAFAKRGVEIKQRIAQPLSGMIESGDLGSPKLRSQAAHIILPLRNCSHILLACTHYPAITGLLKDLVSAETEFIDPSREMVSRVKKWNLPAIGEDVFLTSGDPKQMKNAASAAFGVTIENARHVANLRAAI